MVTGRGHTVGCALRLLMYTWQKEVFFILLISALNIWQKDLDPQTLFKMCVLYNRVG